MKKIKQVKDILKLEVSSPMTMGELFNFKPISHFFILFLFPHPRRLLCEGVNHDPLLKLEYRGPVVMKGKPDPMDCWNLTRKLQSTELKKSASMSTKQRVTPVQSRTKSLIQFFENYAKTNGSEHDFQLNGQS